MWFYDLQTLARDVVWLSLKRGLEALGEPDPAKPEKTASGDGESDKPIMPLMLMSLLVLTCACMVVALLVYVGFWQQYINVVPTKIMVLTADDPVEAPRGPILDGKFDEKKYLLGKPSTSHVRFEEWHFLPIYAFHEVGDLQGRAASYATAWLPTHDFGRHVAFVGTALVLCPILWVVTAVTIGTISTKHDREMNDGDSKIRDKDSKTDASTGDGESSKIGIGETCLFLMKKVAQMYSWLAPVTILWAIAVELSKDGALRLSRYLSLAQYANSQGLISALSNAELSLVAAQGACVLALYVFLWVALALPITIGMRRMHVSLSAFEMPEFKSRSVSIDKSIRSKSHHSGNTNLDFLSALRSFTWRSYRKLLVHYAGWFFVLALLNPVGMELSSILVWKTYDALGFDATNFPSQYMGFWASLLAHLKTTSGKVF